MGREHPTVHTVTAATDRVLARQVALAQVHAEAAERAATDHGRPAGATTEGKGADHVQADPGR